MMTLLNQVKSLVNPYLQDEKMEAGVNEFTIEEGNIAIDVKCEHTFDDEPMKWSPRLRYSNAYIIPKQVLVYVSNEDGNYGQPQDMTKEFDVYEYKFLN